MKETNKHLLMAFVAESLYLSAVADSDSTYLEKKTCHACHGEYMVHDLIQQSKSLK